MIQVHVHRSALKRGLSAEEVVSMWHHGTDEVIIDDREPPRYMRLGFDRNGHPWEIAALAFDSGGRHLIIHAMPARRSMIRKMLRRMS